MIPALQRGGDPIAAAVHAAVRSISTRPRWGVLRW